jgi:hypothetical protein
MAVVTPLRGGVLVVFVGVDLASLGFVVLGGGAFPFGAFCLFFRFEAFSLRAGGLLLCCERGLFGASAARFGLVAVGGGGGGCAALVEILGSLPSRRDSQDIDRDMPRIWYRCTLPRTAACLRDQSITCAQDFTRLRPLWETTRPMRSSPRHTPNTSASTTSSRAGPAPSA